MRCIPFFAGLTACVVIEEMKKKGIKLSTVVPGSRRRRIESNEFFFFLADGLRSHRRHDLRLPAGSVLRCSVLRQAQAVRRFRTGRVRHSQPLRVAGLVVLRDRLLLHHGLRYVRIAMFTVFDLTAIIFFFF